MFWRKKDKPLTREDVGRLLQEAGSPDKLVLRGRNLKGIDLHRADLGGADLSGANLSGARPTLFGLERRSQSGANLRSADLRSADLSGANLLSAHLNRADLRGANLRRAFLGGADLSRADLSTTVALCWRNTTLKPVRKQNWFERSARRGVGLKRGSHLFQTSDGHMRGLAQTVGIALPMDASIGHPTGSPRVA